MERRSHDYVRHGTSTLFAALDIATGTIVGACKPPASIPGVPGLPQTGGSGLSRPGPALGDGRLRRPQAPAVRAWLAANPRVHCHFTPANASWMNLVEVWFSIIERQAIHRGTFGSVKDLNAKIRAYIDGWDDRCHTFVWTKTADQILKKANRQKTSNAGH